MRDRLRTLLLTVCILLVSPASGWVQDSAGGAGDLFLWEIQTPGQASYLCGSIHMMSPGNFPLPAVMEEIFFSTSLLVVEADITAENSHDEELSLMNLMYYEGKTAMDVLPPEIVKKADAAFTELGIPLVMLNAFKPWVLAATLVQLRMESLGYRKELGLDYYFLEKAGNAGLPIIELESPAEQITLMSSLPEELQIALLEDALQETDTLEEEVENIFTAWETGDLREMEKILKQGRLQGETGDQLYSVLLDQRNIKMAEKIVNIIESRGNCFIVLGAAHLAGPGNIRELLQESGYLSRQLSRK